MIFLFDKGDLVLLSTVNLPRHTVTSAGSNNLLSKFIGPFRVLRRLGNAYTIDLPCKMRTHPRSMAVSLGHNISTGLLPAKKSFALKHLQAILVLAVLTISTSLKFGYLPAKPRDILTSFH